MEARRRLLSVVGAVNGPRPSQLYEFPWLKTGAAVTQGMMGLHHCRCPELSETLYSKQASSWACWREYNRAREVQNERESQADREMNRERGIWKKRERQIETERERGSETFSSRLGQASGVGRCLWHVVICLASFPSSPHTQLRTPAYEHECYLRLLF